MDLDKTINEALNDSEIKDAIKEQIDLVTEAKSQERVKVLLEDEISKLDSQCDEFKQELKKENEELVQKAHSGNNLDAFDACNELLQK